MVRLVSFDEQTEEGAASTSSRKIVARQRRERKQGVSSGRNYRDGWRRTASDEQLLDAVTRLGVITLSQAHRYVYSLSRHTVRERFKHMVDAGLLKRLDSLPWAGPVYYPTRAGRQVVLGDDSPLLSMEPPADATMLHRLLVAEEALKLLADEKTIITEREARLYEMGETPDKIEDRNRFLAEKGVRRSINNSPGVVPTPQGTKYGTVERFLLVPTPAAESSYRIPDLFEVEKTGELRAIEIELSPKRAKRMRGILAGYRHACRGHNPEPYGSTRHLSEVGPLYQQLSGVRWVGTEPVIDMICGPEDGVGPISGKEDIGLVRPLWDSSETTHLFYLDPSTWAMRKKGWPVSVEPIDLSHDPGLEYALQQMVLPANYRAPLREWRMWRKVWEKETANDDNALAFPQWLRMPGNLNKVKQHRR